MTIRNSDPALRRCPIKDSSVLNAAVEHVEVDDLLGKSLSNKVIEKVKWIQLSPVPYECYSDSYYCFEWVASPLHNEPDSSPA